MHAKLDTASDLNHYYWYYWGSHKCVFQNAVFLLSMCFILITDSSCREPVPAVAEAWGCRTPQHHEYMDMCACCVRMSNHCSCQPLQTLCVTLQGSLGMSREGCSPCGPSQAAPGLALGDRHELKPHCAMCDKLLARPWAAKAGMVWVTDPRRVWLGASGRALTDSIVMVILCHHIRLVFRSMLWPDSSCPNFSWLKITSLGLVGKSEEGHKWRCLWKTALWHQLASPLMDGQN